jgi:biotin operon repressor
LTKIRPRGEDVRRFLLEQIARSPSDVGTAATKKFGISRQAVSKHLQRLLSEGAIERSGSTRARTYRLAPLPQWTRAYEIRPGLAEDVVFQQDVKPVLGMLPDNVSDLWAYGFTEMFNNAIDHSEGTKIQVGLERSAVATKLFVADNGVGIFRKIQRALGLLDERHAVLELAKGKLTTDPRRHSGEGIFFTSRMFDSFAILSGNVYFSHEFGDPEDWIGEPVLVREGTAVWMELGNHAVRTTRKVFDQYASDEDYGFTKTVVPVRLAQYGDDTLVSRSQAKRLLTRVELFKTVILDFAEVESIGQAFADEIFRVFAREHPGIELFPIHASSAVKRMIARVSQG